MPQRRSCRAPVEFNAIARHVVAEAVRVVPLCLEYAATAGHGVYRELRLRCGSAESRWPGYTGGCIVGQNNEKVPVAGIIIIAAGATAEQQHGFGVHQCDNGCHC
jgi:hypothetical protein